MKTLLLAIFALVTLAVAACTSTSHRSPSSVSVRPMHYVITVHGVRGTPESFGAFHEIAKNAIEKVDPNFEVQTINFVYPVGAAIDDQENKILWTPHNVAKRLNDELFVGPNAKIPALREGDKISFIPYSMGGMMIMNWYYDTMFNFNGQKGMQYAPDVHQRLLTVLEKTENIVGLGSVYWGSLDAELGWTYLENGDTTQLLKMLPSVRAFCERPEIKQIVDTTYVMDGVTGEGPAKTLEESNDTFVKKSVTAACSSLDVISALAYGKKPTGKRLPASFFDELKKKLKAVSLMGVQVTMAQLGNVNPSEMDNMRLTSETINAYRVARIRHLLTPELAKRFKARWSSIIGVFPCLGKADSGVTCSKFKNDNYKKINDGLIALFSGLKRRETDGPVLSPSADADFSFYTESEGRAGSKVSASDFLYSGDLEQNVHRNQQIYVENMHASLLPVLEGLSGSLKSVGTAGASAMKNFDGSLGQDVAVIPKECATPEGCKHPNYKHIIASLVQCDPGAAPGCNEQYLNSFFGLTGVADRMADSKLLASEMGSFNVVFNLRLPAGYKVDAVKADPLKYFKFKFDPSSKKGDWTDSRLDSAKAPYAIQIAREGEVLSSYATSTSYAGGTILRAFFMGRMWAKGGNDQQARARLAKGVPVPLEIALPGLKPRAVEASVRPAQSTYVDMYLN